MAIAHCEYCDTAWDDDALDGCPTCEARQAEEEAYWRQLYEAEKQGGSVSTRDVPELPPDPRTREYWGI